MGKKKRTIFKRNQIRENDEHSGRVYYENAFDVRSKRYEFPSHELINAFLRIFFLQWNFHPRTYINAYNFVHLFSLTKLLSFYILFLL